MKVYQSTKVGLSGTKWGEVYKKAFEIYKRIKRRTKRRPYIRSAYFRKEKVFLELFWSHLHEKFSLKDKIRRLKYYDNAIDLIWHSQLRPVSKENVDRPSEILHRFSGLSEEGDLFFVQIKEDKRFGRKDLISIFPLDKQKKDLPPSCGL